MSDIMEYKCPSCGGPMEFDSKTQKMKCPYCGTEMDVKNFQDGQQEYQNGDHEKTDSGSWEAVGSGQWQEGEKEKMRVYSCKSCGGEIIAEETTGATTCPFCGNRVVMKEQFSGELRPDYLIPFKLDKKAAKEAYHRHLKGKKFLPKIFKQENHIDEIKGIYVPFWLFDAEVGANISYNADRVRVWESGDIEYTEREHFEVQRAGNISFRNVPTDCSKKMDDALMESIEPYHFSDAVPFNPAYLAGYVADRYDVEKEQCIERAKRRMKHSTEIAFRDTVQGYHSVTPSHSNIHIVNAKYRYVLYPVWLLNTKWRGKKYIFAMNGQTGKMVGNLPMDKNAFWKYVGAWGIGIGAVLYALQWIIVLI
ncbi:MAG: hypothetical protein SO016_12455 [Lachnospiraceae bacterium]|nr:hypothetical protein [Robinsoniella sp.]MDY3767478.1 hypothetical protein [Lachnospiraceae bacterium]